MLKRSDSMDSKRGQTENEPRSYDLSRANGMLLSTAPSHSAKATWSCAWGASVLVISASLEYFLLLNNK